MNLPMIGMCDCVEYIYIFCVRYNLFLCFFPMKIFENSKHNQFFVYDTREIYFFGVVISIENKYCRMFES